MKIYSINNKTIYNNQIRQNTNNKATGQKGLQKDVFENSFSKKRNPFFEKIKNFIPNFIPSFTSLKCSPQNFKVKNIKNIRCPACGLITLTDDQVKSFMMDVGSKKRKRSKRGFRKIRRRIRNYQKR